MDPSTAQHHHLHQEMSSNSNTLENMLVCSKTQQDPKKPRPQPEQALKCPRCDSINTKFCYYNNYSLSQPRYFCKSCRRYWTKGGTLRNVPVGGGCRKNKRPSSSSSSSPSSASAKRSQDHQPLINITSPLSHLTYDSNDLTLAFARLQKQQPSTHLGFDQAHDQFSMMGMNPVAPAGNFLDALRCGYLDQSQSQNQNPNSFQNMYYGYGEAGNEQVENGSAGSEMVNPYCGGGGGGDQMVSTSSGAAATGVTVTTMKQGDVCNNGISSSSSSREGTDQNRILWGFPWQLNGELQSSNSNSNNMGDVVDSGREMWNGIAPSWHGLLNSPLM